MSFLPGPTNFVNDMLYSNCQRPFYIYVTTAVPCFIDAVVALRLLDFNDLVRARGKHIAAGGGTPPRGFSHVKGHTITERKKSAPHRGYKLGLHHLLAITQPLEHIGFALLLYGVVNDFYFDWAMYLDDADACLQPEFFGPLIRKVDDGECLPAPEGNTIQLPILVSDPGNWGSDPREATLPVGRFTIVFAATVIGPGGGASYRLALWINRGLGQLVIRGPEVFCGEDQPTDLMVTADVFFPLISGGSVIWVIEGPQVPIGLDVPKADVVIFRHATAFSD